MNFKNMKIEINQDQPLDEVLIELKRLGFYVGLVESGDKWISARAETKLIVSFEDEINLPDSHWDTTTLVELKEMK